MMALLHPIDEDLSLGTPVALSMSAPSVRVLRSSATLGMTIQNLCSAQGQTAERVLIHVDTELAAKDLLNSRMAYVAVSRGAEDAQLYTNDRENLPEALGHDVSHESAHTPAMKPEQAITPQSERAPVIEHGFGMGHSL